MTDSPKPPERGVRVTCVDLETGDRGEVILGMNDFLIVPTGTCRIRNSQHYPTTGKVQITLEGYGPESPNLTDPTAEVQPDVVFPTRLSEN